MPDCVIAVTRGDFTFGVEALAGVVRARWPDAIYVRATGRLATVNSGQFQIPGVQSFPNQVLVDVDIEGQALSIDSPVQDLAAELIAVCTHVPRFPEDDSVVLAQWAAEFAPLRPGMSPADVLALRTVRRR